MTPSTAVAVDDAEEPLTFHDPDAYGPSWDVETIPALAARIRGAVPCSECFPELFKNAANPSYDFQYLPIGGESA